MRVVIPFRGHSVASSVTCHLSKGVLAIRRPQECAGGGVIQAFQMSCLGIILFHSESRRICNGIDTRGIIVGVTGAVSVNTTLLGDSTHAVKGVIGVADGLFRAVEQYRLQQPFCPRGFGINP